MNITMHHQDGGAALLEWPTLVRAARAGLSLRCGCLMCCGSCRSAGSVRGGAACRGARTTPFNLRGAGSSQGTDRADGRGVSVQARARRSGGSGAAIATPFSDLRGGVCPDLLTDGAQCCAKPRNLLPVGELRGASLLGRAALFLEGSHGE